MIAYAADCPRGHSRRAYARRKTLGLPRRRKRLLESAVDIARKRGEHWVGSEHLLLALVKGDDKSIRYLMRQINLEPQVVRSCVERVLQEGGDDLPATQPLMDDDISRMRTGPLGRQSELDTRIRVLQMVDRGKITATEAAELLKAMRFAAVPMPGEGGFMLLPIDEVNFDDLRQRSLRVVVPTTIQSHQGGGQAALRQMQDEIFRLLRGAYSGARASWSIGATREHIEITMD